MAERSGTRHTEQRTDCYSRCGSRHSLARRTFHSRSSHVSTVADTTQLRSPVKGECTVVGVEWAGEPWVLVGDALPARWVSRNQSRNRRPIHPKGPSR